MFCKDNGQRSLGTSGNPESHQFSFWETQWEAQPPDLPFLKTDLSPKHVSSLVPDPLGGMNPTAGLREAGLGETCGCRLNSCHQTWEAGKPRGNICSLGTHGRITTEVAKLAGTINAPNWFSYLFTSVWKVFSFQKKKKVLHRNHESCSTFSFYRWLNRDSRELK